MKEVQSFPETAEQLPSTHESMRRYRQTHRRFDYYASAEAAKEKMRQAALKPLDLFNERAAL